MFPTNANLPVRIVGPTVEPVDLASVKSTLRIDPSDTQDDADILDYISAAREDCEHRTGLTFITSTYSQLYDYLPVTLGSMSPIGFALGAFFNPGFYTPSSDGSIRLPFPPLISVQSIDYVDQSGHATSYDLSTVAVSPGCPGRIAPKYGQLFPFSLPQIASITVTYTAGFGPDPSDVPSNIRLAIKHLAAYMYETWTVEEPEPLLINRLLQKSMWPAY